MPRTIHTAEQLFHAILDPDVPAQKVADLHEILRCEDPDAAARLENAVLHKIREQHAAIEAQARDIGDLKELVARLTEEPLQAGLFLRRSPLSADRPRAEVLLMNRVWTVGVDTKITAETLAPGDEVFLNRPGSLIVAKGGRSTPAGGSIGSFVRHAGGRIIADVGAEQMLLEALPGLELSPLEPGDLLRINRECHLALEKIERPQGRELLAKPPHMTRAQLGGQRENYERLKFAISASLMHREKAASYGINGKNSVLIVGPPGTGKTLMLRIAASELEQEFGTRCSLVVVKPSEWTNMWYGETERKIRETFASLQRLLADGTGIVILYLDEVDSIGRIRGTGIGHADDKALNALLAELDGFADRRNICVVSSTNGKRLLDPALIERLAGTELFVGRPDAASAREIFAVHLPAVSLPFCPNGEQASETRRVLIESAVSRLYAPNADNKVAVIRFTDGKQREVTARELVSGRLIEQICKSARLRAFRRDVNRGDPGLRTGDMEEALDETMQRLRTTLTRENAHHHLTGLPQDVQILAVDAVQPRVPQPRRYLTRTRHEA